ncbi:MAG: secondary thiamine-phosphate synthase enzyme YjbQ [Candidatus Omnitrophica bacterium]|nr:secondary thiamine-phosphate synthase enzyme YjbQ [Candidatus Omnitrophota bacterium]
MATVTKKIKLKTKGNTDIINITPQVAEAVSSSGVTSGIVAVFVIGSTAGITTIEYEPGLVRDLKDYFEKIAPVSGEYEHNLRWHDGNGYAHVRASSVGQSISVPLIDGEMPLGTWQQVILIDFDNKARAREIIVQIVGD